jgi:hypothetical protein
MPGCLKAEGLLRDQEKACSLIAHELSIFQFKRTAMGDKYLGGELLYNTLTSCTIDQAGR